MFLVQFDGLQLLLGLGEECHQVGAFFAIEINLFCKFEAIGILPDFPINVLVCLLGQEQLVAYLLDDVHKGVDEVMLLLYLIFCIELIQNVDLVNQALINLVDGVCTLSPSCTHPPMVLHYQQNQIPSLTRRYINSNRLGINFQPAGTSELSTQPKTSNYYIVNIMQEDHNEVVTDRPIHPTTSCQLPATIADKPHDVPFYTDIRINADDQSSCKVAAYWIIILTAIVLVSVLSGQALPHAVLEKNQLQALKGTSLQDCSSTVLRTNDTLVCSSSSSALLKGQVVTALEPLNQFLVFYLNVSLNGDKQRFNEKIYFKLYQIVRRTGADGSTYFATRKLLKQDEVSVKSDISGQQDFYLDYINDLNTGDEYYWQVQFKLSSRVNDYRFSLESFVINPQYTLFCIILRMAFAFLSVLFLAITFRRYRRIPFSKVTPEHRAILLLSIFMIIFNDPLYIATVLSPNAFTAFLSTFFMWNFITYLFIVWVFFLQRILEEEGRLATDLITFPSLLVASVFYLINMSFRVSLAISEATDRPFTDPNFADNKFISLTFALSTVATAIASAYIFHLYCKLLQRRPALLWRNTIFMHISYVFFLIFLVIFLLGGYNVFQYSASKVMLTFTFTNMFGFFLQYLYLPTSAMTQGYPDEHQDDAKVQGFDQTDISIELQNEGYDVFLDYGASKLSEEDDFKVGKSYLGQHLYSKTSKILIDTNKNKNHNSDQPPYIPQAEDKQPLESRKQVNSRVEKVLEGMAAEQDEPIKVNESEKGYSRSDRPKSVDEKVVVPKEGQQSEG